MCISFCARLLTGNQILAKTKVVGAARMRPAFWVVRRGTIPKRASSFRFASDYRMSKGDSVISGATSSHTHEGEQLG